jgi:hypothetical protein
MLTGWQMVLTGLALELMVGLDVARWKVDRPEESLELFVPPRLLRFWAGSNALARTMCLLGALLVLLG